MNKTTSITLVILAFIFTIGANWPKTKDQLDTDVKIKNIEMKNEMQRKKNLITNKDLIKECIDKGVSDGKVSTTVGYKEVVSTCKLLWQ